MSRAGRFETARCGSTYCQVRGLRSFIWLPCLLAFLKGFQARTRWVAYDPTEETVPIVNATERTIARIAGKVDVSSAIKKRRDQLLQRAASRTSRELKSEVVEASIRSLLMICGLSQG